MIDVPIGQYQRHETALVDEGAKIGKGTKVWHFAHIMGGAKIGEDCVIGQNVFVGGEAIIGDRCKIQNNVGVYDGVVVEDEVFLGPSCVFTNDHFPRATGEWKITPTLIKRGASIGANATIVCGVIIGEKALIGAGAVVTKDVPAGEVWVGNPARKLRNISQTSKSKSQNNGKSSTGSDNNYSLSECNHESKGNDQSPNTKLTHEKDESVSEKEEINKSRRW